MTKRKNVYIIINVVYGMKLRMEIGNVSKRQQPDHRKNNSRRSLTGLQCREKFPHPEASFSWPYDC